MSDLEVFRLSALACGHIEAKLCDGPHFVAIKRELPKGEYDWQEWNPFTNDSQRWECVKKLLEIKDSWITLDSGELHVFDWVSNVKLIEYAGPADEFPARVLAELESRKADK